MAHLSVCKRSSSAFQLQTVLKAIFPARCAIRILLLSMTNKMFAEKDSSRIEREITKLRVLVGMIPVSLEFHATQSIFPDPAAISSSSSRLNG
jgi:hypothetical protein